MHNKTFKKNKKNKPKPNLCAVGLFEKHEHEFLVIVIVMYTEKHNIFSSIKS